MEPYAHPIGLEARDAGCDRGGAPVVRGVSLVLAPGEGVQLFGPNGSGKTSLLAMFAGLIAPAQGALVWRRAREKGDEQSSKPFAGSVFFLGHEASVKPALTARENLEFWANTYGVGDAPARLDDALARVGAGAFAHQRAGALSAGQRRRVDLARAVIAERPVWLLDEPAAAIDKDGVAILQGLTNDHLSRGGVAIIATHDELGARFQRLVLGR